MEEKQYRVIIEDNTENRADVPVSGSDDMTRPVRPGATPTVSKATKAVDKGAVAAGLVAVGQIRPYVDMAINFGVSQISLTTGSAEAQQRAAAITSAASSATTLGIAALAGGVPGLATAAGMIAVQKAIAFAQHQFTVNAQKAVEAENINLRTSRLGAATNRSRQGGVV